MENESSTNPHKVASLLLAAGSGTRMAKVTEGRNKTLLKLGGVPLVAHSLRRLLSHPSIGRLLLVHRREDQEEFSRLLEKGGVEDRVELVEGGPERFDSVYNGLSRLTDTPPEIVLIHDSARPFLTGRMIEESIAKASESGASTVAVPLSDTLKRKEDGFLVETLPRTDLYRIQTPQTFRFDLIWKAHQRLKTEPDSSITDDCMLLEREGHRIALVLGEETNIKVTTPFDLDLASVILRKLPASE